jgi:hypothetical protein
MEKIPCLITSYGRTELLTSTIESLLSAQMSHIDITIHEDHPEPMWSAIYSCLTTKTTGGVGQHRSIEKYLNETEGKYYLHVEEDWDFKNSYDWIAASMAIMEENPEVIKVLCRAGSPHPCKHEKNINNVNYGILEPWSGPDGILWHGFSWNPGLTRLDILKRFAPFKKWEQEVAEDIHKAGYRVAELSIPVYTHTGDGQSTHA